MPHAFQALGLIACMLGSYTCQCGVAWGDWMSSQPGLCHACGLGMPAWHVMHDLNWHFVTWMLSSPRAFGTQHCWTWWVVAAMFDLTKASLCVGSSPSFFCGFVIWHLKCVPGHTSLQAGLCMHACGHTHTGWFKSHCNILHATHI